MTKKSSSVTIRDVASQAGVSVATVSRYINQRANVSGEVAQRIGQVMRELNYKPHAIARQLATNRTNTIGLLLTNTNHDFFGPLLSGIDSVVRSKGYSLLVATFHENEDPSALLPIGPHNADGVIVFANSVDDQRLCELNDAKFPLVLMHRSPPESRDIPAVTVENKAATRKLINHLIQDHGKKHILFLHGPRGQEDSYWREVGYQAALRDNNLAYDPALILWGGFEREIAYKALTDFMALNHHKFDAVFAGDDDAAVGVIEALNEQHIAIPEDIAVVGFDDQRLSSFLNPSLTTVRAPTTDVGRVAAEQIFNVIEGRPASYLTPLPTEIAIRHSCGCEA